MDPDPDEMNADPQLFKKPEFFPTLVQVAAISSTENMAGTPESVGGLAEAFRPPSHHLQHHTPHHASQGGGGGSGDLLLGEDEGGGDGPLTPEMDGLQVRKYCKIVLIAFRMYQHYYFRNFFSTRVSILI